MSSSLANCMERKKSNNESQINWKYEQIKYIVMPLLYDISCHAVEPEHIFLYLF